MRKRFNTQLALGQTPIELVKLPTQSRDELPPVLAGLQWIFTNPHINEEIFELLEKRVNKDKKKTGRTGMDLWHILVLGVTRLALDCDYDRLEYLVHYDGLMRQIMGLDKEFKGDFQKGFHHKTISENVCHVDEDLLQEINLIVAREGRKLFKKKDGEKIEAKADTYVLETNVHFPTDINLLWDASRKCIEGLEGLCDALGLPGWRKAKHWKRKVKGAMRWIQRIQKGGGKNKASRLKESVAAYLQHAYELEGKVHASIMELSSRGLSRVSLLKLGQVKYYQDMLIKHIDLLERRMLQGEKIAHEEKVFSLFEPHTEWINKGKSHPSVELGHKVLVSTDQYGLVLDYKVMDQSVDMYETLPLADRLIKNYGEEEMGSLSFDKGFSVVEDRELLELYIREVIMPKRGRKNRADKDREGTKRFKALRARHNAVESDINALEHHGLNRCPDKGLGGYKRYVGLGILSYNLHKIGGRLLKQRHRRKKAA